MSPRRLLRHSKTFCPLLQSHYVWLYRPNQWPRSWLHVYRQPEIIVTLLMPLLLLLLLSFYSVSTKTKPTTFYQSAIKPQLNSDLNTTQLWVWLWLCLPPHLCNAHTWQNVSNKLRFDDKHSKNHKCTNLLSVNLIHWTFCPSQNVLSAYGSRDITIY